MGTANDVQRLTIARFDAARRLGVALEAVGAAGFDNGSMCVTAEAEALKQAAQALGSDAASSGRFSALFEQPVPVITLDNGSVAYSSRGSLLARFKGGAAGATQSGEPVCCALSKGHQREMAEHLQTGALFLIVGASDNEQYVRCQSLLLRHSSGRVLGVQFSLRPALRQQPVR